MLFIEITKIVLTGDHIGIMLIIEITKLELTGGHIRNMLIKETSKSELTTAILDYTKYTDCLNRIKWQPY